jgi:hypothetical protein
LDTLQYGDTRDDATGDATDEATDDAQPFEPRGQAATKTSVEERKQKLQALAADLQAKMTAVEGIAKASARAGLSQLEAAQPRTPGVNFFPSAGTAHAVQAHDVLPHAVQAHHVQGRQNIPGVQGKSKSNAQRGSNREKQGSGNEEVDDVSEQDDDVSVRDQRPMPMIKNADQQLRGGAAGRVQAGYWSRS